MTTASALRRHRYGRSALGSCARLSCLIPALVFALVSPISANPYQIEISKSQRLLSIRNGDGIHKVYRIASGRGGPGDKRRLGDNKTPVGTYLVIGFNEKSKFDFFIHLNYPNVEDASRGLKEQIITAAEFDEIVSAVRRDEPPPQDTALGGAIGIHGIGVETSETLRIHTNINWTEGCIAVRNNEIQELRQNVKIGTKVVITE